MPAWTGTGRCPPSRSALSRSAAPRWPPTSRRRRATQRASRLASWPASCSSPVRCTSACLFVAARSERCARRSPCGPLRRGIRRASVSIETLEIRPEPYELIAFCQAQRPLRRIRDPGDAQGRERDPDNWRYHFELGVRWAVRASTRVRSFARTQLNPQYADGNSCSRPRLRAKQSTGTSSCLGPQAARADQP